MTLKTQMLADMPIFFNEDEFAEEVLYTPLGGAQVPVAGIVDRDHDLQEPYVRGPDTAGALVSFQNSEVPTPKYGDIFVFDSQTWEMDPEHNVVYKDDEEVNIMLWRIDP